MDLNMIIYDGKFDPEQIITSKIDWAYKAGYKSIALSVEIEGENVGKTPKPPKVESKQIKILNRLTVKVSDTKNFYNLSKCENLKHYQLLAIEPQNEKVLSYIQSGNFDCDLLTFNYSETRMINAIKKSNFCLPISRGIGIEINYTGCLSGSACRRQAMSLGQMLVDKTNGKNIVLSSGATSTVTQRSPKDVVFIGLLFSLLENQSKKAIYQSAESVIKHSELRQNIVSSVLEIKETISDEVVLKELMASAPSSSSNIASKTSKRCAESSTSTVGVNKKVKKEIETK